MDVALFLADRILEQLKKGKRVLWLIPGGSAQRVALSAAKGISKHPHSNLSITLTDERLGPIGHKDSNWRDWPLPQAKLIPVLGNPNWLVDLAAEINHNEYKIGLFGIGADGHTAGLLPKKDKFERISISPELIAKLDEAVLYAEGGNKKKILEDFKKNVEMPALILKKIPKLTIFYND